MDTIIQLHIDSFIVNYNAYGLQMFFIQNKDLILGMQWYEVSLPIPKFDYL